ncbi:hypothetical protein [Cohnella silvisoli]|uniref:Uncharacterized protein n=1 Tax=Cohnella silvisoli TaxID=2873699 RepID=A0ABV1KMC9_9BACL|nr:hypothetical protein [Cohnella silvisoli]MCD9020415.1 hypothetical protein [Cohnella silvisoli]
MYRKPNQDEVQNDMISEHYGLKRRLKERGIKLFSEKQTGTGIEADYICRGYRHHITLLWGTVRSEAIKKASYYTGFILTGG